MNDISLSPKVLAITSSPRSHSNSEAMLDAAIKGAISAGASVEKININDVRIMPCIACEGCHATGKCVLQDDYAQINNKIRNADHLIIATPVYFGSVCTQIKALIDRGYSFWIEKYALQYKFGREGVQRRGLIIACSHQDQNIYLENIKQIMDLYFLCLDIRDYNSVFKTKLANKNDILKYPKVLKGCYAAGRKLVL